MSGATIRSAFLVASLFSIDAAASETPMPWTDRTVSAEARTESALGAMTQEEKLLLVFGYFAADLTSKNYTAHPDGRPCTAGYIPGIARLGIPPQWQTDAGLGVATYRGCATLRGRTSLPSGLATAASWDPDLAFAGGAMIGHEARLSGHNVMLAGGVNLMREPRNGRNFEYTGEDPLLAGVIAGHVISGVQSNHIISTVKHFAFNNQETNRFTLDVKIAPEAARESDLLAFQFAMEIGKPGAVMCGYNRVNGDYACESDALLNGVLKGAWRYRGFVMSDWGATHSTVAAAVSGLDQQSGWPIDLSPYFKDALAEAVADRHVPQARLDDMARRNLYAMFATGAFDNPVTVDEKGIDFTADGVVSRRSAEQSMVLLKNEGNALPLAPNTRSILIVGGHADKAVLSGGGSSQVFPIGGMAVPYNGPKTMPGPKVYNPSSPMKALQAQMPASITYLDGQDVALAARMAAAADVVIVFATQWGGETLDFPDLSLEDNQDALISAVAAANRKTIVVLQNNGPVLMPWLDQAAAVLEAWYPGTSGGEAIANVLTGKVNPSGHLPVTFPAALDQLPRPVVDGDPAVLRKTVSTDYNIEGAAVGYKWFDLKGHKPLFPFGYGLSYTDFTFGRLRASEDRGTIRVSFKATNTGKRSGQAVPQVYVAGQGWEAPKRLAGWRKLSLRAGQSGSAELTIDPRLLARFDASDGQWKIAAGRYDVILAKSSADPVEKASVDLPAWAWRD